MRATRATHAGIALVCFANLMLEVMITGGERTRRGASPSRGSTG
jgi:hypothetical protein